MFTEEEDLVLAYLAEARRGGQDLRAYLEPRKDENADTRELWQLVMRYEYAWETGQPGRPPGGFTKWRQP
jgi:hypothetical protein